MRIFLTKYDPATTSTELEYFLLKKFPNLEKALVRKNHMNKSKYYSSFVVLLVSGSPLNFEEFEQTK